MIGRRSLVILSGRLLHAFLSYVALYFITRYLGFSVYGNVVWALSLVAVFNSVSDLGFTSAHIKKVSEGQDLDDCVSSFATVKIVLTAIMVITILSSVFVWMFILGGNLPDGTLLLIGLFIIYYVLIDLASIASVTYTGKMEMAKSQVVLLVDTLVRVPLVALVALGGMSEVELAIAYLLGGAGVLIFGVMLLRHDGVKWKRPTLIRSYALFAMPLALMSIVGTAVTQLDKVLLGIYWPAADVGYYAAAQTLVGVVATFGAALATVTFPAFSKMHTEGKLGEIRELTFQSERYLSIFGLPVTVVMVLFPSEVATILLGPDAGPSGYALRILSIGMFLTLLNQAHSSQLLAVNRPDLMAKLNLVGYGVMAALFVLLIPSWTPGTELVSRAIEGAAMAVTISTLVVFIGTRYLVRKITGTGVNARLAIHFMAAVIVALIMIQFSLYVPLDGWATLITYGLLAWGVFVIVLIPFRELKRSEVSYFLDLMNLRKLWQYIHDEMFGIKRP